MAIIRRDQAVSTAGKSSFIYKFLILSDDDLEVFLTPAGQPANDDVDRLTLLGEYQVLGVGNDAGGTIELAVAAAANDIITIQGNRPAQPPANFQPGQLSAEELNNAIDGLSIQIEDIQTQICSQMVFYDASNVFNINLAQNKLPILDQNEAWIGGTNNSIIKVLLPDSAGAAVLRAQLIDQQAGIDGSRIVGYFNTVFSPNALSVHDALGRLDLKVLALEFPQTELQTNKNIILGGDFSTNPFQEGVSFIVPLNTRQYIAAGWIIDQLGTTLQVNTAKDPNVPIIVADNADFLYLNSLAIEITANQVTLLPADLLQLEQLIEGNVFRPLAQTDELSLSFWVYSALAGIYCVSLRNQGTGTPPVTTPDRFIVKEYTINAVNTWQEITLDFEKSPLAGGWDYETEVGLRVGFTLAAGADLETITTDTWLTGNEISTANQVNFMGEVVGSKIFFEDIRLSRKSSLPLPRRDTQEELEFDQRYFEKSYDVDVKPGTITQTGMRVDVAQSGGGTLHKGLQSDFAVKKRIIPGVIWFSPV
ncbi:hypothetical protein LCGC14_1274890, partial [marine sediment metagenome]